uniref:Phostensin/Taperin PP1-binding domain-containing protein n=1 Tax=Oncorhynchus mykiss TaxID=8022 RepID=A0A8K9V4L3_ONCMY
MSVSSLPEWKQLLLERKRREEEEREKREKEEEDKLASMPAWKRGIIQRRRMKQESFGDKEREDITGPWLDEETIIPVGQNSFIRTHGGWRRGREAERAGEMAELRCDRGRQRKQNTGGRGEEGEDKLSEEEYRLHYLPPSHSPAPLDSLSPSLLHPPSLAEMSRIYNLKTVGSRAAVCMSDRTVDRPIPSHTPKVQSDISAEQQEPCSPERSVGRLTQKQLWGGGGAPGNKASSSDEKSGLQTVQRQVEQLQLREQQEVQRLSHDDNAAQSSFGQNINLKDKESKAQQSPRISHSQPNKEPQQKHPRQMDQQTILNPRKSQSNLQLHSERPPQPKQAQSNQPKQARSITINSRSVLTPSPENLLHPDQGVPTTPSASPSQSTSVSPSPSPSPTHFTIRSLSGGQQVKRGTTITITPRKPVGGAAVEAVSVSSRPLANTSAQSQMPVLTEEGERGKKRYPTAEEIEVIGGYQNLDKSCLVKTSKASPKGVSVDCRLAYCRLCTINCIDEVSHLVEITPTTRATLPPPPYLILSV